MLRATTRLWDKSRQQRIDRVLAKALGAGRNDLSQARFEEKRKPVRDSKFSLRSFKLEDDKLYEDQIHKQPMELLEEDEKRVRPKVKRKDIKVQRVAEMGEKTTSDERKEVLSKPLPEATDWDEKFLPKNFMNR
jgi:hypothetical protein